MARRKRTKQKKTKPSLTSRSRKRSADIKRSIIFFSIVIGLLVFLAAVGIGFVFLEKYVEKAVPLSERTANIKLIDVPEWVNGQLEEKIIDAATADGEDLTIDEDLAQAVYNNIIENVVWLHDVNVLTTGDSIEIKAQWRKPVALIQYGANKFYVDSEQVVLDFIPVESLPIVKVKGIKGLIKRPRPGDRLELDDLEEALKILLWLDKMDKLLVPEKPLLFDLETIDISNLEGRENKKLSHIILYAKDNTEIIWGAKMGAWQRNLEAADEDKISRLYTYYKQNGTLLGGVKYINLREPKNTIPQPIDTY